MKYSLHSCDETSEATSGSNFLSMQEFNWAHGSRVLVYHDRKAWWWVGLIAVVSGLLVHIWSCPGNRLKSFWKLSQDIILKIWPTVAHFLCGSRTHILKIPWLVKTSLSAEDYVFKYLSLQGHFTYVYIIYALLYLGTSVCFPYDCAIFHSYQWNCKGFHFLCFLPTFDISFPFNNNLWSGMK